MKQNQIEKVNVLHGGYPILPPPRLRIPPWKHARKLIHDWRETGQALSSGSQLLTIFFNSFIEIEFTPHAICPFKVCSSMIFGVFRVL